MMKTLSRLLKDKAGNFAILTALVAVPVITGVGIAIDLGTAVATSMELQNAADSAVLAAASSGETDEEKLRDIVEKVFVVNLRSEFGGTPEITDFDVSEENHITVRIATVVPLTLAKLIRPEGITVAVVAQAKAGSDDKIEIAMVLDNTYSMTGQRIIDLKSASNALLDVFEKADVNKTKVKFAIVPFSRYVNVGTGNRNQSWMNVEDDYSTSKEVCTKITPIVSQTCTSKKVTGTKDGIPYETTQTTCTNKVYGKPYTECKMQTSTYTWRGCVGSRNSPYDVQDSNPDRKYPGLLNISCGKPVTALTNNYATLRAAIKAMAVNDDRTFIAPGVVWGWNMLSSTAPFTEGLASNEDVKKYLIVMTDGANTVSASYPKHEYTKAADYVSKSDALLASACSNAKNADITVFTVAVGVAATETTAIELGKCATDTEKAILVENSDKLVEVFENIAGQILTPRLTM